MPREAWKAKGGQGRSREVTENHEAHYYVSATTTSPPYDLAFRFETEAAAETKFNTYKEKNTCAIWVEKGCEFIHWRKYNKKNEAVKAFWYKFKKDETAWPYGNKNQLKKVSDADNGLIMEAIERSHRKPPRHKTNDSDNIMIARVTRT